MATTRKPAASTTSSTTTESTTDATPGGRRASCASSSTRSLVEMLTGTRSLSPAVARCAIEALAETITDAELREAAAELAETGEVPADLIDDAFEAGQECAD